MAVTHKDSISMGLVLIPIGMYKATVDNDIYFTRFIYSILHCVFPTIDESYLLEPIPFQS